MTGAAAVLPGRAASAALEVVRPGPLALIEDLGRPGLASMGVGRGGAADRSAFLAANRLLGNPDGAAAVEVTLGGLVVRALHADVTFTVTGAAMPMTVDGRSRPGYSLEVLPAGATLTVGTPARGLRSYLAVRGGVDVAPVLGSRSTDVLSGLGPQPLASGDVLPVGAAPSSFPVTDQLPVGPDRFADTVLRVVRGPRDDWLAAPEALTGTTWRVGRDSNRIGLRLSGGVLARAPGMSGRELPSEGIHRGAVQVPPSGEPVVFLADHPVTGGYPVVGVVVDDDVDRAAQLRPGDPVEFCSRRQSGGEK